jgi:hypothetical protein
LDTVTYPDPSVQEFIARHFVPLKLFLNRPEDRERFRAHRVIWTPTTAILDRRGVDHYQSVGYLPPTLFRQMLGIGLARAMLAWARYDEAAAHLEPVAEDGASALAPEALYWLGVARYLKARKRAPMMEAWNRLRETYPTSLWAARIPPNQEDEPEE